MINYSLPRSATIYLHRIGRTGRAGRQGQAITLLTPREKEALLSLAADLGQEIKPQAFSYPSPKTSSPVLRSEMITLRLFGGKKDKLRPGDLLGSLTKNLGLPSLSIGKISISDRESFVTLNQKDWEQKRGDMQGLKSKTGFIDTNP